MIHNYELRINLITNYIINNSSLRFAQLIRNSKFVTRN